MHLKTIQRFTFTRFQITLFVFSALLFIKTNNISGQIKINELLVVNATSNYDPQYFNFSSWIELRNNGSSTVNIGNYYLTDSKNTPTKWKLPTYTSIAANGYITIWCDKKNSGMHTNYELDSDGEGIYLYSNTLTLLDSVRYPKQYPNVSYGRVSNDTVWNYLITPTIAASNSTSGVSALIPDPTFSLPSGRYASTISLSINSTISGVQIRYTTDGSEPTQNSTLYTSAINISATTVIKAKIFTSFTIPSQTVTRTYFINEHTFTLPTVSLSLNPGYLWDNTLGIHIEGTNGITGNCDDVTPKNWNQDWGRYCVLELFNKEGISEFKKDFETKIYGACSRNFFPQKSLAFYAKSKYGKSHLEYPLFSSKKLDKFDSFVLRNSGNDFNVTQFRDALMQAVVQNKFDMDWQAYQPTSVYINGEYWGIMNLREKLTDNYIEHNAKVDRDSIHFLEKNAEVINGSNAQYVNFVNQLGLLNLSSSETFKYIDANIDVNEYINYYITEIYYGNTDWPGNNIKFWRPAGSGGKWRWILFDTDFGFSLLPDYSTSVHKTLEFVTDSTTNTYWPNPQWSTLLFRRLLKNPTFKERFIQTFMTSISSVFKPNRINLLIDSISGLIRNEMIYHKQKWGGSISDWDYEIEYMKTFATERYNFMPGHLKDFFKINPAVANIKVSVSTPNSGYINLNNVISSTSDTLQMFQNLPYIISAIPADGYAFKQWNIKTQFSSVETPINKGDTWKYNDSGANLNTSWTSENFDDSSWATDSAQLGYGDGDENTIVSYGSDASNKYITTYFRKTITITDTTGIKKVKLSLLCDDGAVIYINGNEAARYNMPTGSINYNTFASSAATENLYVDFTIDPTFFKNGNNTISVEIHQNSASSSDLSFDMDLTLSKIIAGIEYSSNQSTISDTAKSDINFIAVFEPKTPVSNIFINEISAKKSGVNDNYGNSDDWFEIYNGGTDTLNLTGLYVTDNFSHPDKFKIRTKGAESNMIAPAGYKVFWADEQEHQGSNHCSFKLSGDGERIGIYQIIGADTLAIDTISYGLQKDLFTWGRYPDGSANFTFMNIITPNDSNQNNTVTDNINLATNHSGLRIYPNPATTYIYVELPNSSGVINYTFYNTVGKTVLTGITEDNVINCISLTPGVYIIAVKTDSNNYTGKIMIRK